MEWQTIWSAVGALATVGGLGFAAWSIWAIKLDSRDRTRPVMNAELQHGVLTSSIELYVSNVGPSVAKNVRVSFNPALPEGISDAADMAMYIERRYRDPIATFGPGTTLHNVYSSGHPSRPPADSTPSDVEISFHYEDSHGRTYSDTFALSLSMLRDTTTSAPSGTDESALAKRQVKALEALARGLGRHG